MPRTRPIRYAVVGLGYITQVAMLPAFAHARRNSRLAALVSGDAAKLRTLGERYGVARRVRYDDFEELAASGEIDAVYVGLPNTLHRDFVLRAARAGLHVLCDKPLAMRAADCRAMIGATRRHRLGLMTAYRLHFNPGYLAAMEAVHDGSIGEPRYFTSQFSMQLKTPNIRAEEDTGGGPSYDLGTYCVNAARHVFRAEPVEVYAQLREGKDRRFRGVEETAQVALRFPGDRLASFTCSFGAGDASAFQVVGTKGIVRLANAYEMVGSKTLRVEGEAGRRTREFANVDQFAPLLLAFSDAVAAGRAPQPSGEEGAADIVVNEAILRSGRRRRPIPLPARRFVGPRLDARRALRVPPHRKPELVRAEGPAED